MKQGYICKWEVKPGPREKTVTFDSFAKAKHAISKLISENVDIDDCINEIRNGNNPDFRNAIADFLYAFCHKPDSIKSADDIPSGDPDDYIKDESEYIADYNEANDDDDDDDDDDYGDDDDCYAEYNFKFEAYDAGFYFRYIGGNELIMSAYFLSDNYQTNPCGLECEVFSLEFPDGKRAKDMIVRLYSDIVWGTSAYPVMVLKALQDTDRPLPQADIISYVYDKYGITMERKSVGRHLDMLKELGFNIQKGKDGFWIEK